MKKEFLCFFIFASILLSYVTSCDNQWGGNPTKGPNSDISFKIIKPISYGHGVYYLECDDGKTFGASLSNFLSDTSKHVVSLVRGGDWGGYWIVVKEK